MAARIEDYALIGDLQTAALVDRRGSIDWLCWPRFDSDACFAALLGTPDHGRWLIAAKDESAKYSRNYRDGTLVLETKIETEDGEALLIEFMPPHEDASHVVRIIKGIRGCLAMRTELVMRFGYGALVPWVTKRSEITLRAVAGPEKIVLRTRVPLRGEDMKTVGDFDIEEGEVHLFTLTYGPSHLPDPHPIDPEVALDTTEAFWREWSSLCREAGEWSATVQRSLITLKALTYEATGGIVAAPTTSLPETLGGGRNWDYRFCWLRDATLTLLAFMNAGFYDEAKAWRDWLLRAVAGSPDQTQIMYGLAGERRLTEFELEWLPGYENSAPVRIGNGAHGQLQLDVYGEVIDTLYQALKGGLPVSKDSWALQCKLLDHLAAIWDEPDRGIWESRGEPRHFVYSKVMAWVAFDRAVKSVEDFGFEGPADYWRDICKCIHEDVCEKGFDKQLKSFVQSYGSKWLDASLLLIPSTGFLPIEDPRVRGTIEAVEKRLMQDGFVMRHDPAEIETGLAHGEGAFLACSYWLADCYMMLGRKTEARTLFERLLAIRNDLGLLAEEYDVDKKRQVGNFPQAFSHIALVTTAHNLSSSEKPAEQRGNGKEGSAGQRS
ncbi:MAG: glycoside hydrolase family 15 protein [Methylobacteriaceae bacterium]|nr:glycoside hydrolase family 15 protein [Methylobacteriaceae bacterium]